MIQANFPWRAGMRYQLSPTHPWTRYDGADASDAEGNPAVESPPTCRSLLVEPDLTDPATIGALAGAVREAYREPFMFALPPGATSTLWQVYRNADRSPLGEPVAVGESEGLAWLAAWNGRVK